MLFSVTNNKTQMCVMLIISASMENKMSKTKIINAKINDSQCSVFIVQVLLKDQFSSLPIYASSFSQ